ncbi:MAG: acyltransferase [Lachnospiraceae bacterium]|jgi:fucose 4-O-acetylase-like acetyltransferase|nr:acyltransferase [Lachnospiraceae bacterium]
MRYKYLDVAKGITLVFILMAHSCGFPFGIGVYCASYFVSFFFVTSGYLQKDIKPNREYIYKRFCRIIIPYFGYNLLIFLIYTIWNGFASMQDAVKAAVGVAYSSYCLYFPIETENNIFFFQIKNNPTWFLTAFFCANLLFLFYVRYCTKAIDKIIIFLLFIVITQILYYCPVFLPWNIDKAFIGADFIIFGYELGMHSEGIKRFGVKECTFLLFLLILYKILIDYNPGISLSTREYGAHGVFSVCMCLIIGVIGSIICTLYSWLINKIPCVGTLFALIGKESLAIMSMHLILFYIFDQIMELIMYNEHIHRYYWGISIFRIWITCMIILGASYGVQYIKARKKRKDVVG